VKFFPAEASGGLGLLKAMAAPYGGIKFIPTGGINAKNLNTYLSFPKVHACGGSWMVKADLISSGKFDEITALTQEAIATMLGFEFLHLGINEETTESAFKSANLFSQLFSFGVKETSISVFAGSGIEIMKNPFLGAHGHIAIGTHDVRRAVAYLKRQGIGIKPDTAREKDGQLKVVYTDAEISGFAIHLLQK
jgi:2-dehydro-3-deoxyphosphogluconate aldolase/(4S)-4-hydroxy-2-oxoglutarate aldolase